MICESQLTEEGVTSFWVCCFTSCIRQPGGFDLHDHLTTNPVTHPAQAFI